MSGRRERERTEASEKARREGQTGAAQSPGLFKGKPQGLKLSLVGT